jgi:uncharacterized protein YijF (DUF1287 family)
VLSKSKDPKDYSQGDIVTWDLGNGVAHIGLVSSKKSGDGARYMMVHNIGSGPRLEDVIFEWKITGHFRYR